MSQAQTKRANLPQVTAGVPFRVEADFEPAGDQPKAVAALARGIDKGMAFQTLLGITGSGKSATVAWMIEQVQRPTLVLAPNKSLAAQLANEFRGFFPDNRVEYFVSYYDYYQPEAYMPTSDTYIEKDSSVNDEIDRLRHSATSALLTRRDVIVVASVSAIYGLGAPDEYLRNMLYLRVGETYDQRELLGRLVDIQYERNDMSLTRGRFSVRGDTLKIHPAYEEFLIQVELFGDEIESISEVDPVTGNRLASLDEVTVFPASHYVAGSEKLHKAVQGIEAELTDQLKFFKSNNALLEAQRLEMRTEHDLEMMTELGYCNGIENYSMHLDGRTYDEPPYTLLDFFSDDFLLVIDESHVAVPQLHGQFAGDRARKDTLVQHGFRLPSARDNRPLRFDEVMDRLNQVVFLSATPSQYELDKSDQVVEQIVRPTGLVDPEVVIKPTKGQIDDLMAEIERVTKAEGRVLVTTLTKKMAEDLSDYLLELGVRVRYLHSDIDTIERIEILRDLRLGEFDVLIGINLLREGLDLPEVKLVAILDADKEGFLRSETSLIQTMGRAARNIDGQVIMYADEITNSMKRAIGESNRRRTKQQAYNKKHNIDPQTIRKTVTDILEMLRRPPGQEGGAGGRGSGRGGGAGDHATAPVPDSLVGDLARARGAGMRGPDKRGPDKRGPDKRGRVQRGSELVHMSELPPDDLSRLIYSLEEEMRTAAADLKFEYAARLRDELRELRRDLRDAST